MKWNFLIYIAITLLLIISNLPGSYSQPQGKQQGMPAEGILSGIVKDKTTGQGIEYASVALYKMKDSSLVNGTISNQKGEFRFEKLPYGMYKVHVKFLGFEATDIPRVLVSPKTPDVNLGEIILQPASKLLDDVNVTAKKEMMTYNLDKKVFTVDQNIAAQGGTLADVMQNIPSVNVDIDGNVSLRGSENVSILIDGKPSQIGSVDEIPASLVESVEIVTNPSAKYDPDGVSGIINIVMKKKKEPGYNAMLQLNAGTGDKYNGSLNFNYRYNRLNLYINSAFRQFAMKGASLTDRESVIRDTLSYLSQDGSFRRKGQFGNITPGFDYSVTDKTRISGSATFGLRGFATNENTNYQNKNYLSEKILETQRYSDIQMSSHNMEYSLGFKHSFEEKKHELSADIFYSSDEGENTNDLSTDLLFPIYHNSDQLQKTKNLMNSDVLTLQTDYLRPIGNGGRLETGLKATWRQTDYDYSFSNFDSIVQQWVADANYTNHFVYATAVYAGYAMYAGFSGAFSYQAGLRLEQAYTHGNQKTSDMQFDKPYFSLFPTLSLKYDISETQALQANYSRRVNRPGFMHVNPFKNFSDPYNISAGNPRLDPEYANTAELSHQARFGMTNLTTTLFIRQTDNMITRITTMDTTGIALTTFQNINKNRNMGAEIVVMQPLARWWKITGNFSYFKAQLSGSGISAKSLESNSWTARLVSNMNLPYGIDFQIMANYRSPVVSTGAGGGPGRMFEMGSIGKTKETYSVDLGMKKEIVKGKASLTLRVSDVFKTSKYRNTSWGDNFTLNTTRTRESRIVFIGFSYKINEYRRPKETRRSEDQMQEEYE